MWVATMKACFPLVNRLANSTPSRLASSGLISQGKGLADMVGDHIVRASDSSGGGDILALCQHKLGVGYTAITLIAGDKPAVVGRLRIGRHSR